MTSMPGSRPPAFSAELMPPAALSPQGFRILMLCCAGVLTVLSVAFLLAGAWPVVGFFGLDLLALYAAFKVSFRRGKAREELHLWPERLVVSRISPKGDRRDEEFQPYWLQVVVDEHSSGACSLSLRSHGRSVELGSFLSPEEKTEVADRLRSELRRVCGPSHV